MVLGCRSAIRTDKEQKDYEIKSKIHDDEILEFRNEIIDLKVRFIRILEMFGL